LNQGGAGKERNDADGAGRLTAPKVEHPAASAKTRLAIEITLGAIPARSTTRANALAEARSRVASGRRASSIGMRDLSSRPLAFRQRAISGNLQLPAKEQVCDENDAYAYLCAANAF
jgi:hypothetical protein